MKTYICVLILLFICLVLYNLLTAREGFTCFSGQQEASIHTNTTRLSQVSKDVQDFLDSVAKIEKQVKTNTTGISTNIQNDFKIESALSNKKHKEDKSDEEAKSINPSAGMAQGVATQGPSAKASAGI
jgi:hypothetical protein